ncbi:MAG: hypothetical protein HY905_08070 [Deltaproteobacteria bacterium]|nr:hypothetical protein [Deltaproteobacteria bacterium]
MGRQGWTVAGVVALLVAAAVCGCGDGGGTFYPDVTVDDGRAEEGHTCIPRTEECNSLDDDCDGETDESWNFETDVGNCGRCFNFCRFSNADPQCLAGVCRIGPCRTDYFDANGDEADGCEYRCIQTTTGEDTAALCTDGMDNDCDAAIDGMDSDCQCVDEICDTVDNDCDELIDEGFDLTSDPNNCGECGHVCGPAWHAASGVCRSSVCGFICDSGWIDENGWPDDGCEARCTPTSTSDTDCDNLDDNCDGVINEGYVSLGCSIGVGGPDCAGFTDCRLTGTGYEEICDVGHDVPTEDITCDIYDDDCDGETDEDYRGDACGTGVCAAFGRCIDGLPTPCIVGTPTLPFDTECDNEDDDCDGLTDEEYAPITCGTGGCMSTAMCILGREWCTPRLPEPETCDGLDNDCDAVTDDGFTCGVGATRACTLTVPTKTCNGAETCQATCDWGSCAAAALPENVETCNSIDDDCDTTVDEAPPAPAVICPPSTHGTTGCSGGTCVMASCDAGWGDVNGSVSDGCECAVETPEAPDACGIALNLGTFSDGGSDVTVSGKLGSATDVDCYSLSAPDAPDTTCDSYHVDIRFTSNPSNQFEIQVFRGDCATVSCTGDTTGYAWYTDYSGACVNPTGTPPCGECDCRPTNTAGYNLCTNNTTSYYFCVRRRTGFAPSCDQYSLRVTNGVY